MTPEPRSINPTGRDSSDALITMGDTVYQAAVLPGVENGEIPAPTGSRRVGRGRQHLWPMSNQLMEALWLRVSDYHASSAGWDDEEAGRDRAAMKSWLDRHRAGSRSKG